MRGWGATRGLLTAMFVAAILMTTVPRLRIAHAQAACGGLGAVGFNLGGLQFASGGTFAGQFGQFGGQFQGGGIQFGGGGFNTGSSPGVRQFGQFGGPFGGLGFNAGLGQFGFQFGGQPGCGTGIFGLIPDLAAVEPGQPIVYRLVWVSPTTWQDLEFLDLRFRSGSSTTLLRWFQQTNQFALVDPSSGQILESGLGGTSQVLRGSLVDVVLSGTFKEDSGPTGQAVGLNVEVRPKAVVSGQTIQVDVGAKGDGVAAAPYELAALLHVLAPVQQAQQARRPDPNDDEAERSRKKTEEQRQQAARTNRSSLDDYRTEGNAVTSDCAAPIPTVTIKNRDGEVVLQLLHDAKDSCGLVQPGDYVEAIGEKQHEQLYEAHQLTVRRNGTRVR